ncbi:CarboxypepD_reg-like domain-containing protein [Lutibacter oricola]|uniref:CarboxypepD_reg-like domain-containing protein n=1 Tax=Lutibacter oricola TaxID=762486 RepID=A0A1H3GM58_9FLAO|nr:carboxypeptidase-like regulatory domain-containing protein [Lutibacter oricola]SDY04386.1 CarboxypepD_reg-like domain-containing protein [Lutibacter oricola]
MKKSLLIIICFLTNTIIFSQIITGTIYIKKTNEVLPGASVYLNGTTIGEISDFNGFFELNINNITNTPVIISYTGFKTIIIQPKDFKTISKIYLEEASNQLKEVFLGLDIWSRQKKLRIFKEEFFGRNKPSLYCTIANEKDIQLIYNSASQTLNAYCNKPIIIKNRYLGYKNNYSLTDFEIKFEKNENDYSIVKRVYTEGYSFFSELNKKSKKRIIANRERTYRGSIMHFMRSLKESKLNENNFVIYKNRWPVNPYKHFKVKVLKSSSKIEVKTKTLSVLYNKDKQSKLTFHLQNGITEFSIDNSGNFYPPKALNFSGDFGYRRISELLPLNYTPNPQLVLKKQYSVNKTELHILH